MPDGSGKIKSWSRKEGVKCKKGRQEVRIGSVEWLVGDDGVMGK